MLKYIVSSIFFSLITLQPVMAQGNRTFQQYQQKKQEQLRKYRERKIKEFNDYRSKKNREFAAYLSKSWILIEQQAGVPAPKQPDPVRPIVIPKDEQGKAPKKPVEVPHGDVLPFKKYEKEESLNIPLHDAVPNRTANLSLFKTPVVVNMESHLKFKLNGVSEDEISKQWNRLSSDDYTPMFEDCARLCQEMKLNGWATWNLCKSVGERLLGAGTNEAVMLQTYLMAELGYDAQMVRIGNDRLVTVCPAEVELCQIPYLSMNNKKYYIWAEIPNSSPIHTYQKNFASATRSIDFSNSTEIPLSKQPAKKSIFTSKWDNHPSVTITTRESLIDCYRNMPLINDWSFYAREPIDADIKSQLLPTLRASIDGKSEAEAANILLHFVQTAFEYQTDEEQYGKEKIDFKEELFYYPACDCEDRSILFSELIHSLIGLDVVLLYYPNHLCTAVKFNTQVTGDYVTVNGVRYVICDPTYINASVGQCMDKYKNVKATIYKIR